MGNRTRGRARSFSASWATREAQRAGAGKSTRTPTSGIQAPDLVRRLGLIPGTESLPAATAVRRDDGVGRCVNGERERGPQTAMPDGEGVTNQHARSVGPLEGGITDAAGVAVPGEPPDEGGGQGIPRVERTEAEIQFVARHRNPLDAIYDALRLETRADVRARVRFDAVVQRMDGLPLAREAILEGIENWISLGVMQMNRDGWVSWTEDGTRYRVRSISPRSRRVVELSGMGGPQCMGHGEGRPAALLSL